MDGVVEVQRKADLLFLRISFHGSFGSFQAGATGEKATEGAVEADTQEEEICFALYLHDPTR
jgi:hypothetical protein